MLTPLPIHPRAAVLLLGFILIPEAASANPYYENRQAPETPLAHIAFRGEPGWLVIGEAFRDARPAAIRSGERAQAGIAVTPLRTVLFERLRPGYVVLVYGHYADRGPAKALVATLAGKGIKSHAKYSGAIAAARSGGRPRLVRLWGRLSDDIRHPTRVEIVSEAGDVEERVFTDKQGFWQAWMPAEANRAARVDVIAELHRSPTARCEASDPGGWYDKSAQVTMARDAHDIYVDWSPSPDCNGE